MVYYSGSAPVRLPIGQNGQVLTVAANGTPNWEFLGQSVDVYYVAEHGTDAPAPIVSNLVTLLCLISTPEVFVASI